jgi:DNA-binding LacI/PurR family transcriptional regulator
MTIPMGRSRIRLVDIATEVGVSRAVVGRVLLGSGANIRVSRDKARQIRQVAKRLNYRPNQIARQLGGKGSQLLGVLIGEGKSQGRFHRLLAVEAEARRRGYRIIIGQVSNSTGEVDQYLDEFDSHNVEAVLYLDTRFDISERLAEYPGAISSLHVPGKELAYAELDRAAGSRIAVEHMVSRGRKRIGLLTQQPISDQPRAEREKERGFVDALAAHGQNYGAETVQIVEFDEPQGVDQMLAPVKEMVEKNHCDAIIAVRDILAVYVLKALRKLNLRVPKDVAVMGFDNLDLCIAVDPELTSLDHSHEACAKAMLDLVVKMKEEDFVGGESAGVSIPPTLVVRQST